MSCRAACRPLLAVVVLASACGEPTALPVPADPPSLHILDGAHNSGNAGFYFLPPLVRTPAATGAFDASLLPHLVVEVCEWNGSQCAGAPVATFTSAQGTGGEVLRIEGTSGPPDTRHYIAVWHTSASALDPASSYRIQVLAAGAELGHADVDVVTSGRELKNVDTGEAIALQDGRALPIKFLVESGAVNIVGADGGRVTSPDGSVTLVFPPGALAAPTGITLRSLSAAPADPALIPGTAWDLGPDGLQFAVPVQLTIGYDPARVPAGYFESSLRIFRATAGGWAPPGPGSADPAGRRVTASLTGFSGYAVPGTELAITPPGTLPSPGSGIQNAYAISASHVVWLDRRHIDPACPAALLQCFPDLASFDLTSSTEQLVTPTGAWPLGGHVSLSGTRLAWADNRSSPQPLAIVVEEIHTLDLVTGITARVAGPNNPSDALGQHRQFVIDGNRLAWWEEGPATNAIVVVDLATSTRSAFAVASRPASPLAMSGPRIVWRAFGTNAVTLLDTGTGVESVVPTAGASFGSPAIAGNRIVWAESRGGNVDIYLYDAAAARETRITTDPAIQALPDISGDRVAWTDLRNDTGGGVNADVFAFDLVTGVEGQVTGAAGVQTRPRLAGDRIVWHDGRIAGLVLFTIR